MSGASIAVVWVRTPSRRWAMARLANPDRCVGAEVQRSRHGEA